MRRITWTPDVYYPVNWDKDNIYRVKFDHRNQCSEGELIAILIDPEDDDYAYGVVIDGIMYASYVPYDIESGDDELKLHGLIEALGVYKALEFMEL